MPKTLLSLKFFLIISILSISLVLTKPAFHVQDQEKLVEKRGRKDKRTSKSCVQVEFFPGVLHCADPEKFCNNKVVNNDKGIEIVVEMWEYDFGTRDEQATLLHSGEKRLYIQLDNITDYGKPDENPLPTLANKEKHVFLSCNIGDVFGAPQPYLKIYHNCSASHPRIYILKGLENIQNAWYDVVNNKIYLIYLEKPILLDDPANEYAFKVDNYNPDIPAYVRDLGTQPL